MSNKKLDTSSKLGRTLFQMKDASVRMKPDIRAIVIRLFNSIEADPENRELRFNLRNDLDRLKREPQLAALAAQLLKALPEM